MGTAYAVFAGGCFWCTEAVFEQLAGVVDVVSGYAGGSEETASYRRRLLGNHSPCRSDPDRVRPARIRFEQLLDVFFDTHDPTTLNRQGHDIGPQYRSAIFVANEAERTLAAAKIAALSAAGKSPRLIVTTIEPLERFFPPSSTIRTTPATIPRALHPIPGVAESLQVRDKHPGLVRTI
jgi:methionine-S-sulfoxide reductase